MLKQIGNRISVDRALAFLSTVIRAIVKIHGCMPTSGFDFLRFLCRISAKLMHCSLQCRLAAYEEVFRASFQLINL
jgi:hypothetical protein